MQVTVEGQTQHFPATIHSPSMPRLAAAYTPKRLLVQFPGIKRQLGETYLEHPLGETHLEHECRHGKPIRVNISTR